MNFVRKYWQKLDLKQGSYLAFLLLSFMLPIGTRKVWEGGLTFLGGDFIDYNAFFLYATDILLLVVLGLWLADILCQFYQKDDWDGWDLDWKRALALMLLVALAVWSYMTLNWAEAIWLTWYRVGRLMLMTGLLAYLLLFIKNDWRKWVGILTAVGLSGFVQVIWGGWQYIFQKGLGLWWLGESVIGPEIDGVAKIEVAGEKIVRAYGSLSHANLYGLFMLFALLCLITFFWLWRANLTNKIFQQLENIDSAWFVVVGLLLTGGVISFSRSVWISIIVLLLAFAGFFWLVYRKNNRQLSLWWLALIIPLTVMIFNYAAILGRGEINVEQDVSLNTRVVYDQIADRMIDANYYTGVGLGNFVSQMPRYYGGDLQWWMYEPVHNTFKLIWAEVGVLGFIFYGLIWLVIGVVIVWENKGWMRWWWWLVWVVFFWLNFVDHYYWDIWVGQLIVVYIWGMLLIIPGMINNKFKI